MTLDEYQQKAMTTCMPSCSNWSYMYTNLVGEVGELGSKVAKAIRKGQAEIKDSQLEFTEFPTNIEIEQAMMLEAGDIMWMISGLCSVMGWSLDKIGQMNLDKLQDRQQRNQIDGNGDYR